ncbi:rhomboid family protein [Aspergillus glaucus CBS 516.65]|uniref:Peptidase S54 rhomboid domain-containing protein n=1 Tax=Aspergillus glaucus CBS 516.65 TaxID=1160497 RepID=A0A1L9VFY4_ASPGL|nr:hypothetical protein ASPGLDRAFT_67685 [Aspergillus glaucus CBS 516.65]OJJ82819.1 hypothetical protein ASPGLDRAFT_67685 [Aspergillus glaucus CBS 516.65]
MVRVNIPPATRICLVSLLTLSLLYNIARWRQISSISATTGKTQLTTPIVVPYLTLVPLRLFYYPWTLLTATFVEQNIFTVLLNLATLFYGGKYLERAWSSREFAKFIVTIAVLPNVVIVPFYLLWAAIRGNPSIGLTQICGGISIQASFLVAFKQLVPEHTVTVFKGLVQMRVKHFPAIFLFLNTISGVVLGTETAAILAWLGLLTSWTYLRFFKRQPDLTGTSTTNGMGIKGDASETFAFACLFPDVIQPPIAAISDQIYNLLVSLRICTPFSEEAIASGNQQVLARGEAGLPTLLSSHRAGRGTGKREEAERRRALALRALDQRLQAAAAGKAQSHSPSSATSSQPTRAATPTVSGQGMLGGTNYTPDNA